MQIELEDRAAKALKQLQVQAAERNLPFAAYLEQLVSSGDAIANNGDMSIEEFDILLDQLSAGLPDLPHLPADFGRADIYADHD